MKENKNGKRSYQLLTKKPIQALIETDKVWRIEIPDVHPSLNAWTRMHFHKRNNLKAEWEHMVRILALKAKFPQFDSPVEMFITYTHPRDNVDLDNFTPKFIVDGLKSFFKDDSIKYLKKLGWQFNKGKPKTSLVEIRLCK